MIRIEPKPEFVELEVIGTLTSDDYAGTVPELEDLAAKRGRLRLLFRLTDFHGWSLLGLFTDIRFELGHQEQIERIAVVGDTRIEEWGTRLPKPFIKAEVRWFDFRHLDEARDWLRGP